MAQTKRMKPIAGSPYYRPNHPPQIKKPVPWLIVFAIIAMVFGLLGGLLSGCSEDSPSGPGKDWDKIIRSTDPLHVTDSITTLRPGYLGGRKKP